MKFLLKGFIKAYQYFIRPLLGENCRFYPSCSDYALQSIEKNGIIKGLFKIAIRLVKCGPWHPGGIDLP